MENEVTDEEIKKLEEELKELEGKDSYGFPNKADKDSLFKFFRRILDIVDTTRIGNVTATELGVLRLGIRHYQELSKYAESEGLSNVANYLLNKSHIITSTSMSKKGFWSELFVTQIKKERKDKDKTEKKGIFSSKKKEED